MIAFIKKTPILVLSFSSSVVITRLQYVWVDLYNPLLSVDCIEKVINEYLCILRYQSRRIFFKYGVQIIVFWDKD